MSRICATSVGEEIAPVRMRIPAPPIGAETVVSSAHVAPAARMTIGSGIFRTPAQIAERVPDPLAMLAVWGLGGAVTLCGALSIAELAAALRIPILPCNICGSQPDHQRNQSQPGEKPGPQFRTRARPGKFVKRALFDEAHIEPIGDEDED